MEIKAIAMVTEEGKRNVKVCNQVRTQMYEKIMSVLSDAGLDVVKAANGDIAIKTCVDASTEEVYYTRLAVSLSNKALESKVEKKSKPKAEDVVVPNLFDAE